MDVSKLEQKLARLMIFLSKYIADKIFYNLLKIPPLTFVLEIPRTCSDIIYVDQNSRFLVRMFDKHCLREKNWYFEYSFCLVTATRVSLGAVKYDNDHSRWYKTGISREEDFAFI